MITLTWYTFEELTNQTLYQLLQARQEVFVVEQNCVYQDIDSLDNDALHLIAWSSSSDMGNVDGYLRLLPPEKSNPESLPSIGRVLTTDRARGTGLGKTILKEALEKAELLFPGKPVIISAQAHLENFYGEFGFRKCSAPYDEDGILHIKMRT